MKRLVLLALTVALAAIAAVSPPGSSHHPATGAGFTVNSTADAADANPGDGVCATTTGACTLRAAIQETNALPGSDEITLPAGTYALTIPWRNEDASATGDLDITDSLTITGAGRSLTVIDANGIDRAIHTHSPSEISKSVLLAGITVTGGDARALPPPYSEKTGSGGGIFNGREVSLALMSVQLTHNSAFGGGGAANDAGGITTIMDTDVLENRAALQFLRDVGVPSHGGGIANWGALSTRKSSIMNNSAAGSGGGIANFDGLTSVAESVVTGNEASNVGGGILTDGPAVTQIVRTILEGNRAGVGGGLFLFGSLSVADSTISGNHAEAGGGIEVSSGFADVKSSTIVANEARLGSNIDNPEFATGAGTVELEATIVASGQGSGSCRGNVRSHGHNLEDGTSCAFTQPTDIAGIDPMLAPLQNNGGPTRTHALQPGSPAVDAGGDTCFETDQRGQPRRTDGNGDGWFSCDIGAFEAPAQPSLATWGNLDCTEGVTASDALLILRFIVNLAYASCGPRLGWTMDIDGMTRLWGDVDCSGGVSAVDALAIIRYVSGLAPVTPAQDCPEPGANVTILGPVTAEQQTEPSLKTNPARYLRADP